MQSPRHLVAALYSSHSSIDELVEQKTDTRSQTRTWRTERRRSEQHDRGTERRAKVATEHEDRERCLGREIHQDEGHHGRGTDDQGLGLDSLPRGRLRICLAEHQRGDRAVATRGRFAFRRAEVRGSEQLKRADRSYPNAKPPIANWSEKSVRLYSERSGASRHRRQPAMICT